jgi:hypothetical protein
MNQHFRIMRKYVSVFIFVVLVVLIIGFVRNNYYSNIKSPLHTELQLAASFGEIRPDHFHMGLDIRTNGKENMPVYAVEDGFISLVKIEPWGYGKAVFVQHNDGRTSVYAHLNRFNEAVEKFVRQQQYATQTWAQDIVCSKGSFQVRKGELIAYSGNTGRSEGPHLHFELRDTKTGNNLNPALYGFAVDDNTAPLIQGMYWYDRRYSTYEKGPTAIDIDGERGVYRSGRKIVKVSSPVVSFGIRAEDRVDGSRFRYGIYKAQLLLDDQLIHEFVLDDISAADSRYVNACIDYSYRLSSGLNVQHLSRLAGNKLEIFKSGDGLVYLRDTLQHRVKILVSDVSGNESELEFVLQRRKYDPVVHEYGAGTRVLIPGRSHVLKTDNSEVHFDENAFYDSVPFQLKEKRSTAKNAASALVSLHKSNVPVHSRYLVKVKTQLRTGDPLREKTVMQFAGFKNKAVVKGVWEGNYMRGAFDELGTVQLLVDMMAPVIEWRGIAAGSKSVSVMVKDDLSEISGFRAEIDGHWVLFDQKGSLYTYQFDENCKPGRHVLKVTVKDVAGNLKTFTKEFESL